MVILVCLQDSRSWPRTSRCRVAGLYSACVFLAIVSQVIAICLKRSRQSLGENKAFILPLSLGAVCLSRCVEFSIKKLLVWFPQIPIEIAAIFSFNCDLQVVLVYRSITMDPDSDYSSFALSTIALGLLEIFLRVLKGFSLRRRFRRLNVEMTYVEKRALGRWIRMLEMTNAAGSASELVTNFLASAILLMSSISPFGIEGKKAQPMWIGVTFCVPLFAECVSDLVGLSLLAHIVPIQPAHILINGKSRRLGISWTSMAGAVVLASAFALDPRKSCLRCPEFDFGECGAFGS